ncbi:MAG: MATE family efflux transporter [Rhodothalassiaceae bacterium]
MEGQQRIDFAAQPVPAQAAPRGDDEAWSAWMRRRLARHIPELIRLSIPAVGTRLGMLVMAFVDTIMVGRYATSDLAALTLANQGLILPLLITGIGLLMGVIVYSAQAYGRGRRDEVVRIFWRNLPYAGVIGLTTVVLCAAAQPLFLALGQEPGLVDQALPLVWILAAGLPGHFLFYVGASVLEGIKRPHIAAYGIVLANFVNLLLNWILVYGPGPFPELGAAGSAWATTVLRWVLALATLAYLLRAPALVGEFGFARAMWQPLKDWAEQRRLGYASAVSLAAEVCAFGGLSIIAGLISTLAVAAVGITFNLMTLPFMAASGIGAATSVRVSVALGRGDADDTKLAGWTGLALSVIFTIVVGALISLNPGAVFALYSDDAALAPVAIGLIVYIAAVLPFDGGQSVISMALRGLGETWWPTAIQLFSYLVLMIPLCLVLALSIGPHGLMIGTLIASVVSVMLQSWRFAWKVARL